MLDCLLATGRISTGDDACLRLIEIASRLQEQIFFGHFYFDGHFEVELGSVRPFSSSFVTTLVIVFFCNTDIYFVI